MPSRVSDWLYWGGKASGVDPAVKVTPSTGAKSEREENAQHAETEKKAAQNPVNPIKTLDGTYVPGGEVVSESILARMWRWPTQFLPDTLASSPLLPIVVVAVPFAFWVLLVWGFFRALKRK